MAKYEAFSDWLEDQASMINCLGKISSDLPILESQRHQIESLLNENENKKSRADRLEQIANELSDPDFKSKMGHLLDQWEALNGRLKDRRNKIDETIIILKKVEAQNKKVEKFNQDAAELINDTIKIQPQLENIDEFISQVNQIPKNHKNASKIKLRRYSEGVLYCSKSVIFSSSRFFFRNRNFITFELRLWNDQNRVECGFCQSLYIGHFGNSYFTGHFTDKGSLSNVPIHLRI